MTADTHPQQDTDLVAGRYEIVAEIGRGGQARTYEALDREGGERVALKELDLRRAGDWKAIELFEREGKVLGSLDHPGIPRYLDAFSVEEDDGVVRFFLAQAFVPGRSLRERIEAGDLLDEDQARALLDSVFAILEYLHAKSPPVVHRDIKPANIILRPDGGVALVDFGAVQEVVQESVGGDTIVGTSGFLPPEQLMGRAMPASDLYALGATVVYAMSGLHPVDLPMLGMRLRFEEHVDCSARFEKFLERMLDPVVEDRLADVTSAREHLEALPGHAPLVRQDDAEVLPATLREGSLEQGVVQYRREDEQLIVEIGARTPVHVPWVAMGALALVSVPLVVINVALLVVPVAIILLSILAILMQDMGCIRHTIVLTPREFRLRHKWGPLSWGGHGRLEDLREAIVVDQGSVPKLVLIEGMHEHRVADRMTEATSYKICEVIERYLDDYSRYGA